MAIKKSKTPEFTVTARVVMVVEVTISGEPDMASALAYAKTLDVREFALPHEDATEADSSVIITGISGDKHYDTEQ
jgi:hypothetical protein